MFRRFLPLLLLAAAPARADEQAWTALIAQGPVSGRLVTWLEVQPRFRFDPAEPTQLLLRPAIGAQLNSHTSLLFGYAYSETFPEGRPSAREHRLWQQLQTRLAGVQDRAVLVARTRLEERFSESRPDDGLRLRQMLRGQYWLGDAGWSVIGTSEVFVGLNSTSWGQRAGLDQWRNFIAVGVPLSKRLTLEAGYLNQWLPRPGADTANNVISLNLFVRIG